MTQPFFKVGDVVGCLVVILVGRGKGGTREGTGDREKVGEVEGEKLGD
jgi:hypothetical protein